LRTWGDGLLITGKARPFETIGIDTMGQIVMRFRPGEALQNAGPSDRQDSLVALGALDMGTGFVLVLAEPRRLTRILVAFDHRGTARKPTEFEVPFGVAATDPAQRQLLMVRSLDRLEAAMYSW